jgi:hypothetical protein
MLAHADRASILTIVLRDAANNPLAMQAAARPPMRAADLILLVAAGPLFCVALTGRQSPRYGLTHACAAIGAARM